MPGAQNTRQLCTACLLALRGRVMLCIRSRLILPVHVVDNLVHGRLFKREAPIHWPAASDVTGIAMTLTASIHQQQLPIQQGLHHDQMRPSLYCYQVARLRE